MFVYDSKTEDFRIVNFIKKFESGGERLGVGEGGKNLKMQLFIDYLECLETFL